MSTTPPPLGRGPRRPTPRQFRARRARLLAGLVILIGLITVVAIPGAPRTASGHASTRSHSSPPRTSLAKGLAGATAASKTAPPAAEAGLLPWQLATPVSREVVAPGPSSTQLVVVGGLQSDGASAPGVVSLGVPGGSATSLGSLPQGLHDAAGARLGDRIVVLGGGDPAATDTTEAVGVTTTGQATALGTLPEPRADAEAVTMGHEIYLVGGYNGSAPDAEVLASSDGVHFSPVAALPVPVRYPAVAALDGKIYAFGGEAVTGPDAGKPLDVVQVVDPARHRAVRASPMPIALAGAAAGVVGGTLYVAGGDTTAAGTPSAAVWAYDHTSGHLLRAGSLPVAVAHAGAAVVGSRLWLVGGESQGGTPVALVQMVEPNRAFGIAGTAGAGSPYYGDRLLIADRGNNRLLVLDDTGKLVWQYPSPTAPAPSGGFFFPDDAFFIRHGTAIISNQEENETVVEIAYPSGKVIWSYGHPHQPGSAPGYLNNPDDAYLLKNGDVTVADPKNCRVLLLSPSGSVLHQIGTTGQCLHAPPSDLGSPNGDTPLGDGNLLISEINGSWVDEYTPSGQLVWTAHLPISYPSDAQQIAADLYLVADYHSPGAILEFNRAGQVLYRYQPTSGPGLLDRPSLVELLPSGVFMANDDHNDRMVAIDPATGALVWQYGVTGTPGTAPGMLNTPDGFDILGPGGSTPTHPATG